MQRISRTIIITLAALLLVFGGLTLGSLGLAKADALHPLTLDLESTEFTYGQDFEIGGIGLVNGRLYGNVDGSNFVPAIEANGQYYIDFNQLQARLDPTDASTTVSALVDGKIALTIPDGRKSADYYLCLNQPTNPMLFSALAVYAKADDSTGVYSVNKAGSVTFWGIKQRPVEVTLNNADALGATVETIDEAQVTVIPHVHGTAALDFQFGSSQVGGLMFGATISKATLAGNDVFAHVGEYAIETPTTIILGGVDVTNCYKISTATHYVLRVLPATLPIEGFERENYYTAIVGHDGISAVAFSEVYKVDDYLAEHVVGQYAGHYVRVTYDVDPDFDPYVAGREEELIVDVSAAGHPLRIVGVECGTMGEDGFEVGKDADYTAELADLPRDYLLRIEPTILTAYNPNYYASTDLPATYEEGRWIAVDEEAMTVPYGRAYSTSSFSMGVVEVEGHSLDLTGEIANIDGYLAGNLYVRLGVGSYGVSGLAVNDAHYSVVADVSAQWNIAPYVLTYQDMYSFTYGQVFYGNMYALSEEESFGTFLEGLSMQNGVSDPHGFVVGQSAYNLITANANQVSVTLSITTGFDETVNLVFSTPGKPLPGYVEITSLAEQGKAKSNYAIAPNTFFFKVDSLLYKVDTTSVVYNGTTQPVVILYANGAFDADPFANMGGGVNCTYQLKNASAQPVNAGKYTVNVSARQPENWVSYNLPYYRLDGTSSRYEYVIQQCQITAYVNMITTSRDFGSSIGIGRICTVALRTDDNEDMSSGLAEVTCRATNSSELPGTYPVQVKIVDANYALKGDPVSTRSDVRLECTVKPMSEDNLKSALTTVVTETTRTSITVAQPTYSRIPLEGFTLRYKAAEDDDYTEQSGLTITGLEEGTEYLVQLYFNQTKSAKYLGSGKTVYGNSAVTSTRMAQPELEEDETRTTSARLAITILNYDPTATYEVSLDGEDLDSDQFAINAAGTLFVNQLEPLSEYYLVVTAYSNKVSGLYAESPELTAYTRPQAPQVDYGDLKVNGSSVKVPAGYMMFVVPYDTTAKSNRSPMTWQEALNLEGAPLDQELLEEALENGVESGDAWKDLDEGQNYLVLVWQAGDPDWGNLAGEVTVYWIKAESFLPALWEGAMSYLAKYLLVGVMGLMALLIVILAIVFAVKKKKISRR